MPFTLLVGPGTQSQDAVVRERPFEKRIVTIGRASSCDVTLSDPRRVVSSRHAEIRSKEERCVLVDTGSTNGTFLNDTRTQSGKEYLLQDGDCIRIGGFVLTFRSGQEGLKQSGSSGEPRGAAFSEAPRSEPDEVVDRLAYLLRRAYPRVEPRGDDERVPGMAELLRRNVRALQRDQAADVLRNLKEKFAGSQSERIAPDSPVAQPSRHAGQKGLDAVESTSQVLSAILGRYCPTVEMPLAPDISARSLARMARVLEVTFKSLADALKGRREFQRELEVDATRILSWSPNPIKVLETEQEIGHVLLDPCGREIPDERLEGQLREVFQDLLLHQMGLLAGMQECLRGLMKEFAPNMFEREEPGRGRKQAASFFERAQTKKNSDAWNAFKNKHQQFSEEEVRLFETILAPYFVRGYLAVQKTKRSK